MSVQSRILSDLFHVDRFLRYALQLEDRYSEDELYEISKKIVSAEMMQSCIVGKDTLTSSVNRKREYSDDASRVKLREKIYKELITYERLDDDDSICLGMGGALPKTQLCVDSNAYIIIGLPASGKSEVANYISDEYGSIIIDSDYAKRKFPEYKLDFGPSLVHEESSVVAFGGGEKYAKENSVFSYALSNRYNVVIPKIGNDKQSIYELSKMLKKYNYKVHILLVRLDRRKATERAFFRFKNSGRYVPLSLIFDDYSNDPTITFYDLKESDHKKVFDSFTMICSDVDIGHPKKVVVSGGDCPIKRESEKFIFIDKEEV